MDGEETERVPRSIFKEQPTPLEVVKRKSRLSREDHALYLSLASQLTLEKDPANSFEKGLVDEIALNYVRLQRARRLETKTIDRYTAEVQAAHPEPLDSTRAMAMVFTEYGANLLAMQRRECTIEDAWYRSMDELDRTQYSRRKAEANRPDPSPAPDPAASRIHLVRSRK